MLAKVIGTALVARLFNLTQPALMRLQWFAWAYAHWLRIKHGVLERARATWAWRAARALKRQWVRRWRALRWPGGGRR